MALIHLPHSVLQVVEGIAVLTLMDHRWVQLMQALSKTEAIRRIDISDSC